MTPSAPRSSLFPVHRLAALVLGFAVATPLASVAAGEPASVTPSVGTNGSELTITLTEDPGPKKPKVWLVPESGKRRRLKVTNTAGPVLSVTIPKRAKLAAGIYTVTVRPRGKAAPDPTDLPAGFEVKLPTDFVLSSDVLMPKDELVIRCNYLGPRRGKVFIGGKKAKVKLWKAGATPGQAEADVLVVKVPKKLKNGVHVIVIKARTGEVVVDQDIEIIGGQDPGDGGGPGNGLHLSFRAQGKKWKGPDPVLGPFLDLPAEPSIIGMLGGGVAHNNQAASLFIQFGKGATLASGPVSFSGSTEVSLTYSRGVAAPSVWSGTGQLTLQRESGETVSGTFSGTLTPVFNASGTVTISQGSVRAEEFTPF